MLNPTEKGLNVLIALKGVYVKQIRIGASKSTTLLPILFNDDRRYTAVNHNGLFPFIIFFFLGGGGGGQGCYDDSNKALFLKT